MPWVTFTPSRTRTDEYCFQCLDPTSPALYLIVNPNKNCVEIKFNDNSPGRDAIEKLAHLLTVSNKDKHRYTAYNYADNLSCLIPLIVGEDQSKDQFLEVIQATIPPISPWRRPIRDPSKPLLTVSFDELSIRTTEGLTAKIRRETGGVSRSSKLKLVQYASDDDDEQEEEIFYEAHACLDEDAVQDLPPTTLKPSNAL